MAKWLLMMGLAATAALACESGYAIWIPRSKAADPLYRFEKGEKAGYIDRNGKVAIPPVLEGVLQSEFHDGLLEVADGHGRYVDHAGSLVIDGENLQWGADFSEGLALAAGKGEKLWGYIDRSGKFVIPPHFDNAPDSARPFVEGLARIKIAGKFGFIDRSGEFAVQPQLLDGDDFSDGMARVVTEGPCRYFPDGPCGFANPVPVGGKVADAPACKFTFIDKTGRVITQGRYDFARKFAEGLAPVRRDNRWGFIDKSGKLVIDYQFEDAQPFSNGLARVQQNGSYGYIDQHGKLIIPPWFQYAEDFSDGLAPVGNDDDGYWYIDKTGRDVFPHRFAVASPFFKGLAHVQLLNENEEPSDTFAYIDSTGRHVFEYQR